MSDRSNENVPRGDHVPGGPNDASSAEMNQKSEPGTDSQMMGSDPEGVARGL